MKKQNHRCPVCRNQFVQPFVCTTCGAQKLYDATLRRAEEVAEKYKAEVERLRKLCKDRPIFSIDYENAPYNDPDLAKWVSAIDAAGRGSDGKQIERYITEQESK